MGGYAGEVNNMETLNVIGSVLVALGVLALYTGLIYALLWVMVDSFKHGHYPVSVIALGVALLVTAGFIFGIAEKITWTT